MPRARWRCRGLCSGRCRAVAGLRRPGLADWLRGRRRGPGHRRGGCAGTRPGAPRRPVLGPAVRRERLRAATGIRHPQRCPLQGDPLRQRRRWCCGRARWLCLCRRGRSPRRPLTSHPIVVVGRHDIASGFGSSATRPAARRRADLHASADRTSAERADPARPAQGIRPPQRWPCRRQKPPPTGAESTSTGGKSKRDTPIRPRQRTHPSGGVLALSAVGVPETSEDPIPHHHR